MSSTTKGVIWSAVERFSVQGVQFLLSIVIARLISPAEYGLIAMLAIFMAVAQTFIDSGFGNALIQKKDRDETDYSTVFYFNILVSVVLYGILFWCAPLIAEFYKQPLLTEVTRWVGLNLILSSFSIVQRTRLSIELNFKAQTKASLASVVISGAIGIYTAYHGWGVWALVVQSLSNNLLVTVLLWVMAKWVPLLKFSIASFKQLFSFGSKLLASALMHTIYLNLYSLVIGRVYNAVDVGYYNRAYSISQYPSTNIVSVICRVIYPVQCEHQHDQAWLEETFLKYLRLSCFVVFPLMILLAVIAKPLVLIVLTEKWLPSAELISILSLAYMWYPVMVLNNQMLNVKGRSDLFLRAEVVKKIVAIAILCATFPFGLRWLCIGVVIYNLLDVCIIVYYTKKVLDTGYMVQIRTLMPVMLLTAVSGMAAVGSMLFLESAWWQIIVGMSVFAAVYIGGSEIFKFSEFVFVKNIIHRKHK
ncbi:MAG: lipopolysaccharide biosynthesis protein [Rikenellaceae bacterium]|nr:lipopolysaccharide biosynthesis protein [Rikenellaceae bacterium]